MLTKLLDDINSYIEYLENSGLYVTVHGKNVIGLLKHNLHFNPFCSLVKSNDEAWQCCISNQSKILSLKSDKPFFGMCYAGVEEFIFPVNDTIFVSVSGYGINRERAYRHISRLADNYIFDKTELINVYENSLKHKSDSLESLSKIINPLCNMLFLYDMLRCESDEKYTQNGLYNIILQYINRNFMNNISNKQIAQSCSCSVSTVCHLFKTNMNKTVREYITELRINQACKLLSNSTLSITSVANMCGFENSNYFSTLFLKIKKCSPTKYRKNNTMRS